MLPENMIKLGALTGLAPPNINSGGPGRREVDLVLPTSTPGTTLPKSIKMILAEPNLIERSPAVDSAKFRNPSGVCSRPTAELTDMNPRHRGPKTLYQKLMSQKLTDGMQRR